MAVVLDVVAITPTISMLRFEVVNAYAVRLDAGFAVIDTGPLGSEGAILGARAQLDDSARLHQIVLTHSHKDHAGSARALAAETGAIVLAGARDAPVIAGTSDEPTPAITTEERPFYDRIAPPGPAAGSAPPEPRGGLNDEQKKVMDEAIAVLKAQGAVIVDPADIPSITATDSAENYLNWGICGGLDNAKGLDASCSIVFKYGMKRDFNAWLASLGDRAPVKTLTQLREWNIAHQRAGAIKYGEALLDISDEMNVQTDRERYEADRRKDIRLSATNGLDVALKANRLDALLFPGVSSAGIAARPGYPTVTVPWAFLPVPPGEGPTAFPAGFDPKAQPFNVSFTGPACSEPKLLALAYAFEQATKRRHAPPLFP